MLYEIQLNRYFSKEYIYAPIGDCILGWVDIGTRTKIPLKFVTYLSKITKINKKSVLTQ
jgi:hypothetical protein